MEFNQIFKYSLFAFFVWNMFGASSALVTLQFELVEYMIQYNWLQLITSNQFTMENPIFKMKTNSKWADDSSAFQILLLLFVLFWTIIFIFILCEPGARMTYQFVAFGEELSRCDWYLLSIELQRMYMIFLSETQNPMKMLCYGNITCDRDTTKKVNIQTIMSTSSDSYFSISIAMFRLPNSNWLRQVRSKVFSNVERMEWSKQFYFLFSDDQQCFFIFYDDSAIRSINKNIPVNWC